MALEPKYVLLEFLASERGNKQWENFPAMVVTNWEIDETSPHSRPMMPECKNKFYRSMMRVSYGIRYWQRPQYQKLEFQLKPYSDNIGFDRHY
ncbi:hypothetical protein V6N12_022408 [Hibiscus sabdariffa]|uniref:Uncharacterized protein n=1 Tax=Hibiscus sabdariffa TaxID=183260 RepID=A0ABR2FUM2_9ROSI